MRISWLEAETVAAARAALRAAGASWDHHFAADDGERFVAPPPPAGRGDAGWASVVEHVARAERVAAVLVEQGLEAAELRFGGSGHAVEVATLAAAAHQLEVLSLPRVEQALACSIDEHLFYAPLLRSLVELAGGDRARMVEAYAGFAARYAAVTSTVASWRERVAAVDDGLAQALALAGRHDDADAVFARRHAEDAGDAAVALSAARTFLAADEVARSVRWLGLGVERAEALGRTDLARALAARQGSLRRRLS